MSQIIKPQSQDQPYTVSQYVQNRITGVWTPEEWLGSTASGSRVIVQEWNKNKRKPSYFLKQIILTDLAATGVTQGVSQSSSPWVVSGSVFPLVFRPGGSLPTVVSGSINIPFTVNAVFIMKSAIITTDGTAGNRQLAFTLPNGNMTPSSKTVGPSSTGDLLDREIVVFGNQTSPILNVINGTPVDQLYYTLLRIA